MKIIPIIDYEDISYDKRFFSPFIVEDNCPNCGKVCQTSLKDRYLSYPSLKEPSTVYMWCSFCEEKEDDEIKSEWKVQVQLKVSLELISEK